MASLYMPYLGHAAEDSRYAALVIDADTGTVLHQENAGKLRYPASLTKMMTIYLTFQALNQGTITKDTRFKVSASAAGQKPSVIGMRAGQTIPVQDLLNAVIIKSANDAAVALADGLAGNESQFAVLMNKTAKSLGMKHTNFANASGLPNDRQVTTAYDLARLAIALRRDYPQYYPMFAKASFTYNGRTFYTHNRVTKNYRGADGLKTGYIRASGFNLVTSARRGEKSLVGVVMGGRSIQSRDTNMIKILDQAFYKVAGNNANADPVVKTSTNAALSDEAVSGKVKTNAAEKNNLTKDKSISTDTNQQQNFSRDVVTEDEANANIDNQKRDIFSPGFNVVEYQEKKQATDSPAAEVAENDAKPVRVRVNGKRVPLPTFKPQDSEKGLVNNSPQGRMQNGFSVAAQ